MCTTFAYLEQEQCRLENAGTKVLIICYVQTFIYVLCIKLFLQLLKFTCFLQKKLPREVVPYLMPRHGPITLAIGTNQKVMSRYAINRKYGCIHIYKWGKIIAIRPSWQVGDNIMFMLYKGINGIFLFIQGMPRSIYLQWGFCCC